MKNETQVYRLNSGGTVVYKMVEDNSNEITESHNKMAMEVNNSIGIAGKVEIF